MRTIGDLRWAMLWFAAPHIYDREMPLTRDAELPAAGAGDRLGGGVLNTSELVFMVMAAAAPMVVALMPMAFAFGNGAGVPGTYVGAMIAMLLFAVGYVQINSHVRNAGPFYAYISASFGRTCGLAAAYVAAISYFALCCSTLGALAFFSAELCKRISGLDVQPFRPTAVFAPGFGIAAIYALNGTGRRGRDDAGAPCASAHRAQKPARAAGGARAVHLTTSRQEIEHAGIFHYQADPNLVSELRRL